MPPDPRSSNNHCTMPEGKGSVPKKIWNLWMRLCIRVHNGLEILFQKVAEAVGNRPVLTIVISFLVVAALASGLHKYKMEKRSDRLFIPHSSRSIRDLDEASKYFSLKFRMEEMILEKRDSSNAIDDNLLKEALILHNNVIRLGEYEKLCLGRSLGVNCLSSTLNILEIFHYNASNIINSGHVLNTAYKNQNYVMSNGKQPKANFPNMLGSLKIDSNGSVSSASSIRIAYFMQYHSTDAIYDRIMKWEESFINYMASQNKVLKAKGIKLYYYAHRSLDDSISESALSDMSLIIVAFVLMVVFCVTMNLRIKRAVNGHVLLAMAGILTVFLGIGASFGLVMYAGTPFIGIVAVLPFMILGVGIDDMFILVDTLDQRHPSLEGNIRLVATLSSAGSSILMTTVTDLIAFAISTVTDFRAIEYFCLYASLAITFVFLLMITFFLGIMKLDIKRVENWKYDVIPCKGQEVKQLPWYMEHSNTSSKLMDTWGKFLMKTPVRIVVVIIGVSLTAVAAYGTTFLDQSFDSSTLGKDNSYQKSFYDIKGKQYSEGFDVNIVVLGLRNYSNQIVQSQYEQLSKTAMANTNYLNQSSNWLINYKVWAKDNNKSLSGRDFSIHLGSFLQHPRYAVHRSHLKFANSSNATSDIIASRIIVHTKDNAHSIFKKEAMVSLRSDIDKLCCLGAFPTVLSFIYYEQFVVILRDTIRNLAVSGAAVLLVTLPYLIHPGVAILVLLGFGSLVFELLAIMYLWKVSLNSISMIVIVMAIGFSVDYSAHIAHAFVVSTAETPEERVIQALRTMGASVAMGGFSTFLGMLATAFASSEVFRIFFKMIFSIVVLGLLHGLLFLPVYLSLFCRTKIDFESEKKVDDVGGSPAKPSTNINHDRPSVRKHQLGRIGSKVIPVSPISDSMEGVSVVPITPDNNQNNKDSRDKEENQENQDSKDNNDSKESKDNKHNQDSNENQNSTNNIDNIDIIDNKDNSNTIEETCIKSDAIGTKL